jgi:hypothetical protein
MFLTDPDLDPSLQAISNPVSDPTLKNSVADPDPGSRIRDWVLFDPWIRDPE